MPETNLVFQIVAVMALAALAFLGYVVFDLRKRFFGIFPLKGKPKELDADVAQRLQKTEGALKSLNEKVAILEEIGEISMQKVGFKRFNPFSDTGGDNSFIFTALDAKNDGVMISSFYTREGVRVYGKKIEKGVSKQPLSQEEKQMLEETIKK